MNVADLDEAAEEKRGRLRELKQDLETLTRSVESRRDSIGAAIATGDQSTVADERARLREEVDEHDGITRAIEMLERDVAGLVFNRREAAAREKREEADQLEQSFHDSVAKLNSAIAEFSQSVAFPLWQEIRDTMNAHLAADYTAQKLAGRDPSGNPKLYTTNSIDALIEALANYSKAI